ncbi:putative Thioesterase [Candidatus Hydrogenisulfobacillus filiaventi]|uniref:Putative Thioesterase n=1 Tax=Candidatus Hydrogenisulfobacillus filiaventi TaxID=2707344 RepID=A0A6F8ZEV7_9FIRM|nr:thioesterase [Bacillota bacterium]CAB1127992.1 putative Thioesterase [Candidatus Hydrogenisulfobacillus filiaventi]
MGLTPPRLPAGLRGRLERTVTAAMSAVAAGNPTPAHVLATPVLLDLWEQAAAEAALPYVPPGYLIVGVHMEIWHLRPTPIGLQVEVTATLEAQDGWRLEWGLEARDRELVARGRLTQQLVDGDRFLAAARAKLAPPPG